MPQLQLVCMADESGPGLFVARVLYRGDTGPSAGIAIALDVTPCASADEALQLARHEAARWSGSPSDPAAAAPQVLGFSSQIGYQRPWIGRQQPIESMARRAAISPASRADVAGASACRR